ncbi:thiazole-phosphate synthase [Stella humosa]|uniref:Thiazole synthase n=1 Tax=Stella humosa TaxID=94 RepID=A0A3N1MF10_9PROT|nr:thiazole synthase [Stella humosa]ROQ01300.1 thiazole-phosphate synthase [Stella humosa]BBK31674.1 thiazole synthase [Stella humosa]
MADDDILEIAGRAFRSRILVGTAGYPSRQVMLDAIDASGAEIVTVSLRRVSLTGDTDDMVELLAGRHILPNTAGCSTRRDAMLTAELGREALGTDWVKLELIGDRETLYPDAGELIVTAAEMVREGFTVLPYATDDPVVCRRLADVGCAAVMPLGSPIGSGLGILNPFNIEQIVRRSPVPVILDAGIGTASDAAFAMELGCSAVLLNSAIAKAHDPVRMARAMGLATAAGRAAALAGRIPRRNYAEASSPQLGLIGS